MDTSAVNRFLDHQLSVTSSDNRLFFAHVTDLHVEADTSYPDDRPSGYPTRNFTAQQFSKVVDELNALSPKPDFVLFGGDLTNCGLEAEWHRFFKILGRLELPYYLALGNHDHSSTPFLGDIETFLAVRQAYPGMSCDSVLTGSYTYDFMHGEYAFVVLDSKGSGELSEAQHAWLDEGLTRNKGRRPLVVSVHRPLLSVGNWVDWAMLRDRSLLEKLIACDELITVLSGHTHKSQSWLYRGARHLINPALAYGIGDRVGYRFVCLAAGVVAWSAVRYLHGSGLDQYQRWHHHNPEFISQQLGDVRLEETEAFESHPLCAPSIWPHEVNPAQRDISERRVGIPAVQLEQAD